MEQSAAGCVSGDTDRGGGRQGTYAKNWLCPHSAGLEPGYPLRALGTEPIAHLLEKGWGWGAR